MTEKSTVRTVTYDLLRSLGLTTIFGNPGSTEETFLQEFPGDFSYVLALQEASAIAMADAFAQVTRRPALVNLHSSAGVGNAMGNLVAAYHGNTPLIVTAGQQHRELMIGEPYLGNREATTMPRPWVKWSYEPYRAQDVPEAFMRAYAMALQPPAGPVFLSIPLDDWNQPLAGPARVRTVSDRVAPDAERLRLFAGRISASRRPALVFGPDVDRSGGWDAAVALAEKLRAAVYGAPLLDRASFPEDHPLFRGPLGMSVKTISDRLAGHDLAVVIGAEVFRYYPYVPGDLLRRARNCCRSPPVLRPPRPRGWATPCWPTPRSRSSCSWTRSRRAPRGPRRSRWPGRACCRRCRAARLPRRRSTPC